MRDQSIATDRIPGADGPDWGPRSLEEPCQEVLDAIKSYLECRSGGVEPSPWLTDAWERFYQFYSPRIRGFLRRWPLSEADRSDCLQDVWHEVVSQLPHFVPDPDRARLSTWLLVLARNRAVDAIRRRTRHSFASLCHRDVRAAEAPDADPAAAYERGMMRDEVRDALAELSRRVSPTSYRVVYLRWIEGLPTAEVAAALALTPEQVRFRTCRMKQKIRQLLEQSRVAGRA